MRTSARLRVESVDDQMAAIFREKSVAERLEIAFGASRLVRLRLEAHISTLHPEWKEEDVAKEVARRISCGSG